jgi:hypothetical protein
METRRYYRGFPRFTANEESRLAFDLDRALSESGVRGILHQCHQRSSHRVAPEHKDLTVG